jgi:hypothetical protein
MDFVQLCGKHPEELRRRRSVRAFPAVVEPEGVLYLFFAAPDSRTLEVLRLERIPKAHPSASLPSPPDEAWGIAISRFDARGW